MFLRVTPAVPFWGHFVLTVGGNSVTVGSMKKNTYLSTLIERQESEGWSDREMARQLGVGKSTWSRIRSGERGIGTSVLRRAMSRFPEYNGIFLLENASMGSTSDTARAA